MKNVLVVTRYNDALSYRGKPPWPKRFRHEIRDLVEKEMNNLGSATLLVNHEPCEYHSALSTAERVVCMKVHPYIDNEEYEDEEEFLYFPKLSRETWDLKPDLYRQQESSHHTWVMRYYTYERNRVSP